MASTKKYLDKAGLNYLWQKIRLNFSDIKHNHDGRYIQAIPATEFPGVGAGKVANWVDGDTLEIGKLLQRDVKSTNIFVDETEFWAGNTLIPVGVTGSTTGVVKIPYAGYQKDGVVTTISGVTGVSDGVDSWHAVPIVNGIPYYHDTLHQTYTTTPTTKGITGVHGATFAVIDGVTIQNGHITGYNTTTVMFPTEPNMVETTGTLPTGNIVVGAANNKTVKDGGYSVGGNTIKGTTGKLATEVAVKDAIDKLPMSGVTGNILSIDTDKKINTTLSINFDTTRKYLQLIGKNNVVISEFDASEFVKDAFLDGAGLSIKTTKVGEVPSVTWTPSLTDISTHVDTTAAAALADGPYLVFVWNLYDSGTKEYSTTFINVNDLFEDYFAGNGIDIKNHIISVKVDNKTAPSNGLYGPKSRVDLIAGATGLRAEIDLSGKVDRIPGATAGNIVVFGVTGALVDSGKKPGDYVEKSTVIGSTGAAGPTFAWNSTIVLGQVDGKTFQFNTPNEPVNHEALNQEDIEGAIADAEEDVRGATGPTWHPYSV